MTKPDFDVIVLGGGAAGLFCALTAAQRGRRVLVLEKSNKVGKKILMSGGGRCNFTNLDVTPDNFISANPHFCISALSRYTQWDFIAMVDRHNIAYEERKHGQLFCLDSARDILDMLVAECDAAGVQIRTKLGQYSVQSAAAGQEAGYKIIGEDKVFTCQSLVVATGALSIPTLGGSDFGYTLAEQFGLPLLPRWAGLVPFMFSDAIKGLCERLAGTSLPVTASCRDQSFTEALLFTHRGLSGPVILQISNYWLPGEVLTLDLLPGIDASALLTEARTSAGASQLKTVLQRHLPKSLALELLFQWQPDAIERPLAECSDVTLQALGRQLNHWELKPAGTEGYRTAEVTLGGVDTNEISSKTMEARQQPGLYFIGEVLDVTGHLGGFNFQWAWSSGYAAGVHV
ncbi:NAD(P)/FAD-dependent oxidoreductase [Halieaceae bacterium IMCC14734]|uniref:NAD(P)/FAD-dependent oxidoreductase n=1 Tax=Candidatus Litorirhabdus singularis TaxID=2518993 RepID=A0ABT3TEA9_9GAMM|nr:NAD(P)/FAD-dependent oxidoreductase [Candidatus Litorirhabdus singularis]MCX2980613.1 NAD(P)/FAD-dependent oxidoreductase [Candidatus Litorirhabdus singularis]